MQLEVKVAKATQTAIPELNREAKDMYYLVIGEGETAITINTGKATYDKIKAMEAQQPVETTKPKK